jgi:hypothetical protein
MGSGATCASFRTCCTRDCDVDRMDDDDDSSPAAVGARDPSGNQDRAKDLRSRVKIFVGATRAKIRKVAHAWSGKSASLKRSNAGMLEDGCGSRAAMVEVHLIIIASSTRSRKCSSPVTILALHSLAVASTIESARPQRFTFLFLS